MTRALVALGLACAFALGIAWGQAPIEAQRSSAPRRGDQGRSTLIYPPQAIALRMDHSHPAHRDLPCTQCHAQAAASERSSDLIVPAERTCEPCHADRTNRAVQTEETCGFCHRNFDAGSPDAGRPPIAPASTFPSPRLKFSHRAHVQAGQSCESCHVGVRDARLGTRQHLPTMRQCFTCHAPAGLGEGVASRPLECEACHEAQPDGRLVTQWPEGWMNPPRWMAGMRHDHEWIVRHRWVAADQGSLCAECHAERDCVECHDGRVRSLRVHPGDYLTTHVAMARRDEPRCASCHTVSQFCAECHARLGISQIAAPDVRSAQRWHPPAALWIRGPNLHATEATRSMQTCASCHAEQDCVACHGSRGAGGLGLSPHPPGFARSCRAALESNARACVTCHGELDEIRALCR